MSAPAGGCLKQRLTTESEGESAARDAGDAEGSDNQDYRKTEIKIDE